jgi:hypothetical protein
MSARTIAIKVIVPVVEEIRTILHFNHLTGIYHSRRNHYAPPKKVLLAAAQPDNDVVFTAGFADSGGERNSNHAPLHWAQVHDRGADFDSRRTGCGADEDFPRGHRAIRDP